MVLSILDHFAFIKTECCVAIVIPDLVVDVREWSH
jgi:hypothetical protein